MAFPGLKYASSGLLAALRLGRRTGKKGRTPPSPSPGAQEAVDAAASPVASLAPLTEIISTYLDPKEVERVREAYRFADQAHLGQFRQRRAVHFPPHRRYRNLRRLEAGRQCAVGRPAARRDGRPGRGQA